MSGPWSSNSPKRASTAPPPMPISTPGARFPARSSPMAMPTTPAPAMAPISPPKARPRSSATGSATSAFRPRPTGRAPGSATPPSASIPPATCRARRRFASRWAARSGSSRAITRPSMTASASRSSPCAATASSPKAPSACRSIPGRRRTFWRASSTPGGPKVPRPASAPSSASMRSARRSVSCGFSTPRRGRSSPMARSKASRRCSASRG